MTWFKIDDPGTDYTRVSVDVPNDYVLDVLSAVRACMPATERPAHEGSSPESGCGARESVPGAEVGMDAAHEPGEEAGGEGAAVISVAFSVPRGGSGADMRWPAPHMTVLPLCDLAAETMADLRAVLAAEVEGGEAL